MQRISGPIADRIDMWIEVGQLSHEALLVKEPHTPKISPHMRAIVSKARERQSERQVDLNSALGPKDLETHCELDEVVRALLQQASAKLELSARAVHKVIKIARTIADIDAKEKITDEHVLEALQYRKK
jgi:magnesium chelatase family protein